jgi:hypothetical protein
VTYRLGSGYRPNVDNDLPDILNLNLLIEQLALALGLAMVFGNAFAIYKNRTGGKPKGEEGEFRRGRAYWLLAVGVVIAVWGAISLIA